jgi:hypothetical protein
MGRLIVDLANPDNWESVWNTSVVAASVGEGSYIPIPEISCPLILSNSIVAIGANSNKAASHWRSAGFLNYKIRTGLLVGGSFDSQVGQSFRIKLHDITLLTLPQLASSFAVSFNIHYWIEDIQLNVWSYTGSQSDSTEDLIRELLGFE